jgi:hypothetical protein
MFAPARFCAGDRGACSCAGRWQTDPTPGEERILFIVGSGHLPILRFVTEHSPEYELVDVTTYLRLE